MEKVFAAAEPPAGNYVQQYTTAQKEMYLPPASHTPSYDATGNLLSDGWWTYEYDGENRLIRQASVAYHPDGRSRELLFNYDYLGRRVKKTVKAYSSDEETLSTTAFVYWDWHLIAELNVAWNGTVSRKRQYVWGLDKEGVRPGAGGVGGLLMVVDNVTNKTYLAMNDYIGNVIGLVDPDTGSVVAAYVPSEATTCRRSPTAYDPFGRPIRATGTYAAQNPIRFSSQYTDHETGLVYFGFRYYHPQWGRFINRDPIEEAGGENLYRFVSNDPVNRWDLLGLADPLNDARPWLISQTYIKHHKDSSVATALPAKWKFWRSSSIFGAVGGTQEEREAKLRDLASQAGGSGDADRTMIAVPFLSSRMHLVMMVVMKESLNHQNLKTVRMRGIALRRKR